MRIEEATMADAGAIEALLDAAFAPGRKRRTAYRLRDGAAPDPGLSLVARDDAAGLAGSLQCWPVALWADGRAWPLVLLGPVAVRPDAQGRGVGSALMDACMARAGERPMLLIGDEPYYGRWGFHAADTGGWIPPGPVDRHRLLARDAGWLPWRGRLVSAAEAEALGAGATTPTKTALLTDA
jgi:predicted N-acetyltransferase YhbS